MLKTVFRHCDLDFSALMALYAEGNADNARDMHPYLERERGILAAENDFYCYLQDVFFRTAGALYALWEENGVYISGLRLEPYRDGLLLAALETHPDYRRQGYAKKLISAVLQWLIAQGREVPVYSHVNKRNAPSLQTHCSCGFQRISEQAVYIDGSVTSSSCTMCFPIS